MKILIILLFPLSLLAQRQEPDYIFKAINDSTFAWVTPLSLPVSTATQTALNLKADITNAALITPTVSYTASPSAPSADKVRLYDYKVGGKDMLGFIASFCS